MQISNVSIASLFQEMQSLANGSLASSSFGTQLTGQNLPTITSAASSTSSLGASPLSTTPSSQFASNILSALLSTQEAPPSAQSLASQIIGAINPGGNGSLSLAQVEQSLTGSSATTSPEQLSIANAFAKLDTNGDGALSQSELAAALQSTQQSDPLQGLGGHHHHHHHHIDDQNASATSASTSSSTSTTADSDATTPTVTVATPTAVSVSA